MSNCTTVIKLINSLSSSEKRNFRLSSQKHAGKKDYLLLYDLINTGISGDVSVKTITENFNKKLPESSIDATAKYLLKVLTDRLIESKIEKDKEFMMYQSMLRVKVLQERSLQQEAYREIKKIREQAISSQHHIVQYLTFRMELNHLSDQRFPDIRDNYLVEMQMKAKEVLRLIHNIEGHYSLYELIKFRLSRAGKILSDAEKRQMNDLLLSEISLVTGKVKNSFESKKLHQLFQSFYFTDIADHRSALKSFSALNKLFEQHPDLHDNPPMDYFSALDGILDSLRTVRQYNEMEFYIEKLQHLDNNNSPEYFRFLLKKTIAIYRLAALTGEENFDAAAVYVSSIEPAVFSSYNIVHNEKQAELYFYCGLTYFGKKDWKKAHKYVQAAIDDNTVPMQLGVYKALRLLNIMIYYEQKDTSFLQYEIRSYTRAHKGQRMLTKCEKLVFKTVQLHPSANSAMKNNILYKKLHKNVQAIKADRYEEEVLKYVDVTEWVAGKFGQK